MSTLDQIAITVEGMANHNGRALLHEIQERLVLLVTKGQKSSIDLSRLPLTPDDHALLRETLGEGEVHAEVSSLGPTEVRETAIPGVWWLTHYNAEDEVMTEFIEITRCPEIILTPQDDLKDGVEALRMHLLQQGE